MDQSSILSRIRIKQSNICARPVSSALLRSTSKQQKTYMENILHIKAERTILGICMQQVNQE